jgi:hypothetical protein
MDTVGVVIAWIVAHFAELTQIIGIFAVIATLTPNESDDKIVKTILDGVNFLGGNLGKAANPKPPTPE